MAQIVLANNLRSAQNGAYCFLMKIMSMTPLRKTRIKKGLTLSAVATSLALKGEHIDTGNLSRIERGIQQSSPRLAEALAALFSDSISEMHVLYPERYMNKGA